MFLGAEIRQVNENHTEGVGPLKEKVEEETALCICVTDNDGYTMWVIMKAAAQVKKWITPAGS